MTRSAAQKIENLLTKAHELLNEHRVEVADAVAKAMTEYADTITDADINPAYYASWDTYPKVPEHVTEEFRAGIRWAAWMLKQGLLEYDIPGSDR